MKNPFKTGDTKQYIKTVKADETATFETGAVHPFYATFALGRDAELGLPTICSGNERR